VSNGRSAASGRGLISSAGQGVDRVFHALGDPTRRAILERLSEGPASISHLARPLELTVAAVVQHVQVLEESGLVSTEKSGRVRTCRLEPRGFDAAEQWIGERRTQWQERFDRLEQLLDEPSSTDEATG
jgi:DNA-binding transcriptional ArsR family regulator